MICSNCGKEIMEGATYCLECGASIDEPIVLADLKPKNVEDALAGGELKEKKGIVEDFKESFRNCKNYTGPLFDFSGYVKSLGSDTSILIGLIAAILVYLAPFFSWLWTEHFDVKNTANLFELGGKNSQLSMHSTILIVMAVLIILSAIDMLAFSGCRYVGPLKAFEKNYIVRVLPAILSAIFGIVIVNSEKYKAALEIIDKQEATAERLGSGFNYSGGIGIGAIFLVVGIVLYVVSIVMDYSKRKNNG